MTQFFHGVEYTEGQEGPRPISAAETAIVGMVGTAPYAPASYRNVPTLINTRAGLALLGADGDLPGAIAAVWEQASVPIVAVVVPPADLAVAAELEFGDGNAALELTAVAAGLGGNDITVEIVASGEALAVAVNGNAITVTPAAASTAAQVLAAINADAAASALVTAALGDGSDGTGAIAALAETHLAGGIDAVTLADQIGTRAAGDGIFALLGAESDLASDDGTGIKPRILCAPGFAGEEDVATALAAVADALLGFAWADGGDTNDADALTFAANFDAARLAIVDPQAVTAAGATVSGAAYAAGTMARVDLEQGYWVSPSNQLVRGISKLARSIDYGDTASSAHILNAAGVNTFIRATGGFRTWGGRTTSSSDARFRYIPVRRTADQIEEAIRRSHLWAVDRGIRRAYFAEVVESVNGFLRDLRGMAIIDGICWADPEKNTPAAIARGEAAFSFEFTPVYPAEKVSFTSIITDKYLEGLTTA